MEYRLCEAKTAKKLQRTVNGLMGNGWRPVGGVSVAQSNGTAQWWYYQAMTRSGEASESLSESLRLAAKPSLNDFDDLV